jgi:hypothetical protein
MRFFTRVFSRISLKRTYPFFILFAASLIAAFILFGPEPSSEAIVVVDTYETPDTELPSSLTKAMVHDIAPAPQPVKTEEVPTSEEEINYTDLLVQSLANRIRRSNPIGPQEFEGQSSIMIDHPQELADYLLREDNILFDYGVVKPTIHPSDLALTPSDSRADAIDYLTTLSSTLGKYYAGVSLNPDAPNFQQFARLETAARRTLDDLYELSVPFSLAALHAEEVALITAQKNIYGILARSEDDLFKSLIAMQYLERVDEEFAQLGVLYTEYITTHNISL